MWPLPLAGSFSAAQRTLVQRLMQEKALLGYWVCEDCCSRPHAGIRDLADAYTELKAIDPFHVTFGSVNCDSPWLFGEAPSTVSGQRTSQLSLDVPALVNYGALANHMGETSDKWRDVDYFRHRIWASAIASMPGLDGPATATPAAVAAAVWTGVVVAESYISIGWTGAGPTNNSIRNAGIAEYQHQRESFAPHALGTFGNTRLNVIIAPPANQTVRGRAWYIPAKQQAYVLLVHTGTEVGEGDAESFSASVVKTFNPRLMFASFSGTIVSGTALLLEMGPTM